MNTNLIVAMVLVGLLVGLILSYSSIKKIIRIYRTPTEYVGALPLAGPVEVVGKAKGNSAKSLLKRTSCSLWQVIIEERKTVFRRFWFHSEWVTIYNQISNEPFELSDETGSIWVFPAKAQLILYDGLRRSNNYLHPLPRRIKNAIQDLGILATDMYGLERPLRVYERLIKPGDEVYVLGELKYEKGSKRIEDEADFPLLISDRSEKEVLRTLYGRIISNIVMTIIIEAIVVFISVYAK